MSNYLYVDCLCHFVSFYYLIYCVMLHVHSHCTLLHVVFCFNNFSVNIVTYLFGFGLFCLYILWHTSLTLCIGTFVKFCWTVWYLHVVLLLYMFYFCFVVCSCVTCVSAEYVIAICPAFSFEFFFALIVLTFNIVKV